MKNRYPQKEHIPEIASVCDKNTQTIIHYNTNEPETLLGQLQALTRLVDGKIDGFQVNIPWVDPEVISEYKNAHPEKIFIFQVS